MVKLFALLLLSQAAADPAPEEIQKAREELRALLRDQYARPQPEQRQALARKLLGAAETEPQPAQRLAMLLEAGDVAVDGGDLPDAVAALETLSKGRGRWPALRLKVLELQERKDKAGAAPEGWMRLCREALEDDEYTLAQKAADKAESTASRRKDAASLEQAKALKEQTRSLAREFKNVEDSFRRLKEAPEDPAASDAVGRFLCFTRDRWAQGLPHLARSADAALAEAAAAELAKPATSEAQAKTARAWRQAADKKPARLKTACEERALEWYGTALQKAAGMAQIELQQEVDAFVKTFPASEAPLPGLVFWVEPGRNPGTPFRELQRGLTGENLGVTPGPAGTPALHFNGKSSVVYPAAGPVGAVTRGGSVFAWIKVEDPTQFGTIVNRCENRFEGPEDFGLYVHAGHLQCYINWEPPDRPPIGYGTAAVPAGKWFLGGYTWDESRVTFYADGKKDNSIALAKNTPLPRGSKVVLGVSTPAGPAGMEHFIGLTGSVMIFNRTLSDPEVERLHTLTLRRFR